MTYEEELEAIREDHDGFLRPEDVVRYARDPATELHKRFDWADSIAAEKWRVAQARGIIRAVVRVLPRTGRESVTIRAYVSLLSDRQAGDGYRIIDEVLEDPELSRKQVALLLEDLERLIARYETFMSLRPALAHIERAVSDIRDSVHDVQMMAAD
jgi:hypothetical protein